MVTVIDLVRRLPKSASTAKDIGVIFVDDADDVDEANANADQ
jgi:hypothetical protein